MYWITEDKEGVVYKDKSENERFQEDEDVLAPKLPKEHRLDNSHKFLISLLLKKAKIFNQSNHCCLMYWIIENEEGVIYEDDFGDDEDYVWADQLEPAEEGSISEIQGNSEIDDKLHRSDEPDPYDYVYSNLPNDVHVLKLIDDCKKCGAKRFQYETKGFCCCDGQVKLAE
jgi:hypothetical protein